VPWPQNQKAPLPWAALPWPRQAPRARPPGRLAVIPPAQSAHQSRSIYAQISNRATTARAKQTGQSYAIGAMYMRDSVTESYARNHNQLSGPSEPSGASEFGRVPHVRGRSPAPVRRDDRTRGAPRCPVRVDCRVGPARGRRGSVGRLSFRFAISSIVNEYAISQYRSIYYYLYMIKFKIMSPRSVSPVRGERSAPGVAGARTATPCRAGWACGRRRSGRVRGPVGPRFSVIAYSRYERNVSMENSSERTRPPRVPDPPPPPRALSSCPRMALAPPAVASGVT
jgi:hypothetical protein